MLNEKEKAFAAEYIINKGNAYQAALKAGYSKSTAKNAFEWLSDSTLTNPSKKRHLPYKPELVEYISERLAQMDAARVANAQEIMIYLTSVMRGESEAAVLRMGADGQEVLYKPPDEKERLKAAETLAKIHGLMTTRVDMQGTLPVVIENDLEE